MPLDKELVLQKCKYIITDIENINSLLKDVSYEEFATSPKQSTLAERYLERIVNRSVDINFHLVKAAGGPPPDDYTDSFLLLATIGVLDAGTARSIAPAAGVRNILVHEYDDLDMQQFYASLENIAKLFPAYIKAVSEYIEK